MLGPARRAAATSRKTSIRPPCPCSRSPRRRCRATASDFLAAGFDSYLSKPVNVVKFVHTVRQQCPDVGRGGPLPARPALALAHPGALAGLPYLLSHDPAPPPGRGDQRRGGRAAPPGGAGRLRPHAWPTAGAPGRGRVHHRGTLRRPTVTGDGLGAATLDTVAVVAGLPERPVVHLDAGYDTRPAGRCTQRRRVVVEFWLALAAAAIVCGRLLRRAWSCYRWEGPPRRRP